MIVFRCARRLLLPRPAVAPDERGMLVVHRDPGTQPQAGRFLIGPALTAACIVVIVILLARRCGS